MLKKIIRVTKYIFLVFFIFGSILFFTIQPSNSRDWKDGVAVLPYAKVIDNNITVYNIRNFKYKTEKDYKINYYDKSFDLKKLNGVDLISVYWMGPSIAHVFLSFSFSDGERLAISIETRNEKGEGFSAIKGFFRQYELFYVVADERDVIKLRTNYRDNPKEDVYIYKLKNNLQSARKLFMEYINQINILKKEPTFYNTLTTNCTTTIWLNSLVTSANLPFSWKILVSGYTAEYLYENSMLEDYGLSFEDLQKKAHINERANNIKNDESFSVKIRE